MAAIHPTALIDSTATISPNATIGPFCIVGENVTIGAGTTLISHCRIDKNTIIGENNTIYPQATIGCDAQDYATGDEETYLEIGDNNIFRENVTIHRGTKADSKTIIGNNNFLMVGSHVAHNCIIGNNIVMVNGAGLAGYAIADDNCILSANTTVHQFCRVGRFAMISGNSGISKDLPPFVVASERNNPNLGINRVGLRRSGVPRENITELTKLYKLFFCSGLTVKNGIKRIKEELTMFPEIEEFIAFVEGSKRGVLNSAKNVKLKNS